MEFTVRIDDPKGKIKFSESWEYAYFYDQIRQSKGTTTSLHIAFYKDNICMLEMKEHVNGVPYGWSDDKTDFILKSKMKKKNKHIYIAYDLLSDIVKTLERQKKYTANKSKVNS